MKSLYLFLPLILLLTSCVKEDDLKKPFISFTPEELNDGWNISSPENEGVDSLQLSEIYREFHARQDIWQARSLLVFRNGKLVAESYTKEDADQITPRAMWSCTKQVIGLLTGIALEKGLIHSTDDNIGQYLPETDDFPDKKNITIEQLLTMRSGIDYSNDGLSGQSDDILRQLPDNVTRFILGRQLKTNPGEIAFYKDCDPQLVACVIQQTCGKKTREWAKEVLFDPMKIKNMEWMDYKDGTTLGGFGIMSTPREMSKFGQLVLDSGMWKGNVIVGKDWIKEMTTIRVEDMYSSQFCYLWWKDESRKITYMHGHGGQFVCIVPDKKLIVMMTAEVNTQDDFQFTKNKAFEWVDRIVAITR
jgi:CubicO group peptidase (beta-lactamase class C family)